MTLISRSIVLLILTAILSTTAAGDGPFPPRPGVDVPLDRIHPGYALRRPPETVETADLRWRTSVELPSGVMARDIVKVRDGRLVRTSSHADIWQSARTDMEHDFGGFQGREITGIRRWDVRGALVQVDGTEVYTLEQADPIVMFVKWVQEVEGGLLVSFSRPLVDRSALDPAYYTLTETDSGAPIEITRVAMNPTEPTVLLQATMPGHGVKFTLDIHPMLRDADGRRVSATQCHATRYGSSLAPMPDWPDRTFQHNVLSPSLQSAGWQSLFDGRTTNGWRRVNSEEPAANWIAEDGTLARVEGGGDIMTTQTWSDFELVMEWKVSPGGNSGIFYRVGTGIERSGPEMQVLDNSAHRDGASAMTSAGSCYAMYPVPEDLTAPVGSWNQIRIVCQGERVQHWMNGVKAFDYTINSEDWIQRRDQSKFKPFPQYGQSTSGHIQLQDHGDLVWYRNIRIRPLS